MVKTKLNSRGFHVLPVLLVIIVVAVIGLVGWRVTQTQSNDSDGISNSKQEGSGSDAVWRWGGDKWTAQDGTAPDCGDGPVFEMPVDINKVSSVLYPGQQRSTGYKGHGGFLFEDLKQTEVDVTIPIDSHIIKASRYIEQGEVQYFFVFSVPCGFTYRFDHLQTLTPKFQAIADKLPEPKVDDSRTTDINPAIAVKAGTKIATGVGFKTTTAFDFGVYDVRQANEVSKDAAYAAKHQDGKEFEFYGVCFFDYMGDAESTLRGLPAADQMAGKTSDYCK